MKNNLKRLLSVFVALLMVLSVSVSAFALEGAEKISRPLESKKTGSYDLSGIRNGKTFNIPEQNAEEIAADQIVPIMVELQDAPAMEIYSQYKAAQSYAASLREKQDIAVKEIRKALNVDIDVLYNYTLLFNGFGFEGEYRLVEELNKMEGVRAFVAAEWETPEPQLFSSTTMIGAPEAWDLEYTGEGKIVAIIDTGMKVNHEAFANAPENPRFAKSDISAIIAGGQLDGGTSMNVNNVYYSAKIPFRWNYVKHTYNVDHTSVGSDHGTHVAGIAAGNGGQIVGVAKDAQIAAMNVFNDGGGAGWQAILLALEDCVVLGVDSANMSLGSPCGFTHYYDPSYSTTFENLVNAGVNLAVSAGNEYSTALRNAWNPTSIGYALAVNPDYGVTGSPSTWPESLGVASVDNAFQQMYYIENVESGTQYSYTENSENAVQLIPTFGGQTLDFVAVPGYGEPADFDQVNVQGKVAVVSRGEINFVTKGQNAQAAGAVACIVYNNTDGSINMVSDPSITIPFIFCLKDAGDEMAEMGEGQIFVATEVAVLEAPGGGQPSDFSSWGSTSDLFMKPEIAAPGGNIYSSTDPSISNTMYDTWSGTSMAAPHVTGGMAIVTEYVEEMFPNATKGEQQRLVNAILMSTADPVNDSAGSFAAVRKQGAGLMDLASAVTTTSYISVPGSVRPKLELGDDPDWTGEFSMTFQVVNFGDTELTYNVVPYVLTDDLTAIDQDPDGNLVIAYTQTSWDVTEYCDIEAPETVTVPAGETVDVDVTVTLDPSLVSYYAQYTQGMGFYVEGFIELVGVGGMTGDVNNDGVLDTSDVLAVMRYDLEIGDLENPAAADINGDGVVDMVDALLILRHVMGIEQDVEFFNDGALGTDLNVPFLGFCGDWNAAPMLDIGFYYDDYSYGSNPNGANFIGAAYGNGAFGLGINPYVETDDMSYYLEDRNAVSPNGDGFLDTADTLLVGLMRNAATAGYQLLDDQGNVIANLRQQNDVRKSYYSTSSQTYSTIVSEVGSMPGWNAEPYAGQDIALRIYAELANDGSVTTNAYDPEDNAFGEWIIPIYVDVEAPEAEVISFANGALEIDVHDNHYAAYAGVYTGSASNGAVELGDLIAEQGIFEDGRDADTQITFEGVSAGNIVCIADYAGNEVAYVFDGETLVPAGNSWSHQDVSIADAEMYAYGKNLTTQTWVRFNTADMASLYYGGGITSDNGDYTAGTWTGDYVYAVTANKQLVRYDAADLTAWSNKTTLGTIAADYTIHELAYNKLTGKLYGVAGVGELIEINPANGAIVSSVDLQYGAVAMDFDSNGVCYIIDAYGYLCTMDVATGLQTGEIANIGISPVDLSAGSFMPQCGTTGGGVFYWFAFPAAATMYSDAHVIGIDIESGMFTDMGSPYDGLYCIGMFCNIIDIPGSTVNHEDFYDNFEAAFNWENVDADGDGLVWSTDYFDQGQYQDGSKCAVSYSYTQEAGAFEPDNWMISEAFEVGENRWLSFFTSTANYSPTADWDEHYAVYVIPEGGSIEDAINIFETTMDDYRLTEHKIDLSMFDGETIQIAFRHFNCYDEYTLLIDSVAVGTAK